MLTNKQRSYLRALANNIDAIFQVGKNGINDNLVQQVRDALETRELVKITVLKSASLDTRDIYDQFIKLTFAEPVQVVGNRFVLYKQSREHQQIFLNDIT